MGTDTTHDLTAAARRTLERLREAPLLMPHLHYSVGAHEIVKMLGSRDRAQRALVTLVQAGKVRYLENCSPDHYQAYAEVQGGPWVPVEDEAGA